MPRKVGIGDFFHTDGSSLYFEACRLASHYSEKLVDHLEQTRVYSHLATILSPELLRTYFIGKICGRLMGPCRQSFLSQRGASRSYDLPNDSFYPLFRDVWMREGLVFRKTSQSLKQLSSQFRDWRRKMYFQCVRNDGMSGKQKKMVTGLPLIAIEAVLGIDPAKRSDALLLEEGIDPGRILFYFDHPGGRTPEAWKKETLKEMERKGMRWVCLSWRGVEKPMLPWSPGSVPSWTQESFWEGLNSDFSTDSYERYAREVAVCFLKNVDFWRCFFREHNIKIQLLGIVNPEVLLAQRAAMDLEGGVLVGRQRSYYPPNWDGSHGEVSHHLYFCWGNSEYAFNPKVVDCCNWVVTSGFPYDHVFPKQSGLHRHFKDRLKEKGVRFSVALLDNTWGNLFFTHSMAVLIYSKFLQWLLDNPDVGLILKPKKSGQLERLSEVQDLLEKGLKSGRLVWLKEESGRLATDASCLADLTVGVYFSSAALEAAIAGYRAVHCDFTRSRTHPFYQWGHRKVVFEDLDDLMGAIDRYRQDTRLEPNLGDHSPVMDQLDPFRDHQGAKRITEYLAQLLKNFENGCSRDVAIAETNKFYSQHWGFDKIFSPGRIQ